MTTDGVKVRIDPPQDHNRWGQGQDRPTSRSQPDGVKVRIDPPQGHNLMGSRSGSTHLKVTTRWGQGQDRPTSRSQPMGSRSGLSPKTDTEAGASQPSAGRAGVRTVAPGFSRGPRCRPVCEPASAGGRSRPPVSCIDDDAMSSQESLDLLLKRYLRVICLLPFDVSRGNRSVAR